MIAADAEAICEEVTRANMRFAETKAPEQQAGLMLHRARHLFIPHMALCRLTDLPRKRPW